METKNLLINFFKLSQNTKRKTQVIGGYILFVIFEQNGETKYDGRFQKIIDYHR